MVPKTVEAAKCDFQTCAAFRIDRETSFTVALLGMGLAPNATRFLIQTRIAGVQFDETLTLGRQYMMVSPERIRSLLRTHALWPPDEGETEFLSALRGTSWRFEVFARALGARNVTAMDASTYEGATVIHDLNVPIPPKLEEKYDVVIDGGTLEHVFNFPVAIANCMKMVKIGGHLILLTVANNYFGHGFYQFSPELFFRVLSRMNGFEVTRMIALEDGYGRSSLLGVKYDFPFFSPWFEVRDPEEVHDRVILLNSLPVSLFVVAKRISREVIFKTAPQQSDYVPQWQAGKGNDPFNQSSFGRKVVGWLRGHFSESFYREWLPRLAFPLDPFRKSRFRHKYSFANRDSFRKLDTP